MNFYIGNSIGEIKFDDYNIEFSDDLLQYIYNQRKQISADLSVLFEIDPYSDTFLEYENVKALSDICSLIIEADIIKGYDDYDEGVEMLEDLLQIADLAVLNKNGLVIIGDWKIFIVRQEIFPAAIDKPRQI